MKVKLAESPFVSIQGEGELIGTSTIFVRFSGCNLKCSWCDTQYAWKNGKQDDTFDIVNYIEEISGNIKHIVFTGGEPMLKQDAIISIIDNLNDTKYHYTIETNGTIQPKKELIKVIDLWSVSPKPPKYFVHQDYKRLANKQIKVVVYDEESFLIAKKLGAIVQPKDNENLYKWANLCSKSGLRIIPQLHKIMGLK